MPGTINPICILTTADMHGRTYDTDAAGKPIENNLLQAAQIIADRRAAVDDSILVDNGDLHDGIMTMASIYCGQGKKDLAIRLQASATAAGISYGTQTRRRDTRLSAGLCRLSTISTV